MNALSELILLKSLLLALTFVNACAQLERLTLWFNATTNFPTPEQIVSAPMLCHLDVCTSPVGDVDAIAAF